MNWSFNYSIFMMVGAIEAVKTGNEIINSEIAIGAFNRFMITFFSKKYKKYLTNKLVIEGMAKVDAERQISEYSKNPSGLISLAESELELEYKNMFSTLAKALPKIESGIPNENEVDLDVMKRLKDLSKDFSSDDMQEIVSGILAGEYNKPGSFCLKTLDVVKNLTKNDIILFQKFCGIVFDNKYFFKNSYNLNGGELELLESEGIGYNEYLYLQDIGLVGDRNTFIPMGDIDDTTTEYNYKFSVQNQDIVYKKVGCFQLGPLSSLTKAGEELLTISGFIQSKQLLNIVKNNFTKTFKE